MNTHRIATLIGKELREFRANPSAVLPVAIVSGVCIALPFIVIIFIPSFTGESLAEDRSMREIVATVLPGLSSLPPDAAIQAFLFQQFLMLFLVNPIIGAVSLAAYSVVGEKQGRTLEPLLTTPLTTTELLLAKVLAAFLPSIVVEAIGLAIYLGLVSALALPGVVGEILTARSVVLLGVIGPLASLAALQMTIAVSSRVNDVRSAQQIAVLLVLPLVVMLVGQIAGLFIITMPMLVLLAIALAALWSGLIVLSVALFERETILTRWK
jgi:ABC-2 type transport system permease protein